MTHIKRIRMAVRWDGPAANLTATADSYRPWSTNLLAPHAETLFQSFRHEPDTCVFPSLGTETGCRDLMHALASISNFCPESTWLAMKANRPIGAIQGIVLVNGDGEIQNLAVIPSERGRGIGRELLRHCLDGFRQAGCERVVLEVSASNETAIRLYRKFGFRSYKTVYLPAYGSVPSLGHGI